MSYLARGPAAAGIDSKANAARRRRERLFIEAIHEEAAP